MSEEGKVNIHGKTYLTVAYRVNDFRSQFGSDYGITTKLIESTENRVVMKATICGLKENSLHVIATGYAEEFRGSSQINKTSALENCETSAIGRALANFGLGGTEYASANEVQNAIHQQETPFTPEQKTAFDDAMDCDPLTFWIYLQSLPDETKLALYASFPKGEITKMKKQARDMEGKGSVLFAELKDSLIGHIDSCDTEGVYEIGNELGDAGKRLAFSQLNPEQQQACKELMGTT